MEAFCGSKFWDLNVTWHTETPDLTPCFEKTVLVWIPCAFLWLCSPFEIGSAWKTRRRNGVKSLLHESILFLTLILFLINLARFIYSFVNVHPFPPTAIFPVDHVAPAVRASTYALAFLIRKFNNSRGIHGSGILFFFWLLTVLCEVFEFQTNLRNPPLNKEDDQAIWTFAVILLSFPVQVVLVILNSFSDFPSTSDSDASETPCPQAFASVPSRLVFAWACPLVYLGYKRPIETSDLWLLNPEDEATRVINQFNEHWTPYFEKCRRWNKKQQKIEAGVEEARTGECETTENEVLVRSASRKIKLRMASILPVMWKVHGQYFLWGAFLLLAGEAIMFASPQILDLLIQHVGSKEESWKGYFYSILMLITTSVFVLIMEQHIAIMTVIGMRTKSALISSVYRKSLLISNAAKRESTTGEIVNLMSIDAQRFSDLLMFINDIWGSAFSITLAMYFLYGILGPSIFAGIGVLGLLVPVTAISAAFRERFQAKLMETKDQRVKLINEVLSGIKVLKFYAWEPSFENEIEKIRQKEINILRNLVFLDSFSEFVFMTLPFMITLVIFATYVLIDVSHILDARKAFVALALLNMMRSPMLLLPYVIALVVQTKVSVDRLNKFLNAEEIDTSAISHDLPTDGTAIRIEDGVFSWGEVKPTLRNINVRIPKGSLTAVVGTVGTGKSSLLSAILGEMRKVDGSVNTWGSIAYLSQQAWIQNETLRGNVLFGEPFDQRKYNKIIQACDLQPDLEVLPGGDTTEIGEKGINLSGGQKQRVALARAAYNDADLYLLDDPLSAVDTHVGKHLFEEVIGPHGILKGKTRLIVTHGLTYLPQVDCIIVMKDGVISEIGTFQKLLRMKGAFADFLTEYLKPEDLEAAAFKNVEGFEGLKEQVASRHRLISQTSDGDVAGKRPDTTTSVAKFPPTEEFENKSAVDKLIEDEKTETGSVDKKVYLYYVQNVGCRVVVFTLIFYVFLYGSTLASNIWLSVWSMEPATLNGTQDISKRNLYLTVYGGLGLSVAIFVLVATISLALGTLHAAKSLHNLMLRRILRSPMSFFDTTPLGRIVNRFSKDTDVADSDFPMNVRGWLCCSFEVLVPLIGMSYSTPWILVVFVPVLFLYFWIQRFYVPSSRQLKRLESVSRSPIYSHFSETLTGTATLRAFSAQSRFTDVAYRNVDKNLRAYFPSIMANRWLAVSLQCLGNIVTFFAALLAVIFRPSPGIVGLSLSYALDMVAAFNWVVRNTSAVETNAVAIERIKEYGETPQEADWEVPSRKPGSEWPQEGRITFQNFQTRYREGLDLVLKSVSCEINPGEKVGIVGRTGAGKSSMTLGLFRIIEAAGGSITIDGANISQMGLHDLRGKLTIIPQDPVLFAGSLRMNLDPFEKYSDSEVWTAIEYAHLKEAVLGFSDGLLHKISEGGENLSVGQRQLVCLARALLRKTKILILDEATAAVDLETDDLIQATIRKEFHDCTVLTIAHRLNTILDYNKVMVLDNGQIREFDDPKVLLANSETCFYGMAKNAGVL